MEGRSWGAKQFNCTRAVQGHDGGPCGIQLPASPRCLLPLKLDRYVGWLASHDMPAAQASDAKVLAASVPQRYCTAAPRRQYTSSIANASTGLLCLTIHRTYVINNLHVSWRGYRTSQSVQTGFVCSWQ